jgi:hypothetical protein
MTVAKYYYYRFTTEDVNWNDVVVLFSVFLQLDDIYIPGNK